MGASDIKLGVCSVTYNGVNLGYTKGGVELTYKGNWHDITVDQAGTTKIRKVLIGEEASVKTNLAEDTFDNIVAASGGAGQKVTDGTKHKVIFGRSPGFENVPHALVLHPIAAGASNYEEDVTIYKAAGIGDLTRAFQLEGERVVPVTFEALADLTRTDGDYLMCIGDSSAALDLAAPTISLWSPVTGAVGVDKAVTTTVQITFNKAMDPNTINAANLQVFQEDNLAVKAGTWSYLAGTFRAVFTPDAQWAANKEFIVIVGTGVKSLNGVALAATNISNFTTGA